MALESILFNKLIKLMLDSTLRWSKYQEWVSEPVLCERSNIKNTEYALNIQVVAKVFLHPHFLKGGELKFKFLTDVSYLSFNTFISDLLIKYKATDIITSYKGRAPGKP